MLPKPAIGSGRLRYHPRKFPLSGWSVSATNVGIRLRTCRIENHGFNELVNSWNADHVYRHEPNAIECFLLLAFLAYNIFHAFVALNLKPELRRGKTDLYWARLMAAEIHADLALSTSGSSP